MALFSIWNWKVKKIKTIQLDLEKNLQKIFEWNLDEILNIIFLASEYSTSFWWRIDTLWIDKNGSPVIIEYKRNQNDNVINQWLSYLRWLLDHKADFEILCKNKKIDIEIDWTSPRVICIAESYNKFDLDTVEILPLKIELLRYKLYENNILQLDIEWQTKIKIETSKIFNKNKKEKQEGEVSYLQKEYSIEYHLEWKSENIKKLFYKLREIIISLDENIIEEPKWYYIAYKLSTNFVDLKIYAKSIDIYLNMPNWELRDINNYAINLKNVWHQWNWDYRVKILEEKDIDNILDLIKQSYNYNK